MSIQNLIENVNDGVVELVNFMDGEMIDQIVSLDNGRYQIF